MLTIVLLEDSELREGETLGAGLGLGDDRREGGRLGTGVVLVAEPCLLWCRGKVDDAG